MLAYRLSAAFVIIFGTLFAVAEVVTLLVYYQFTERIAGWDFYSFLALMATCGFIQHLYQFLFVQSHEELMDKIIEGQLDYDLVRPVDSQLLCSIKNLDYPSLVNLVIPIGLIAYCWPHLNVSITMWAWGAYTGLVLCGVAFYYLLNQVFVSMAFWIERPQQLMGIPEYLFEFASRPRSVYPRLIQAVLSVGLPVLTATNLPVEVLQGGFNPMSLVTLAGSTVVLGMVARVQWLAGVRRYASAN